MADYAELEKRLQKYEIARAKKGVGLQQSHQELLDQARVVQTSLDQTGEYQMAFCKAVDVVIRAECQYFKEIKAVFDAVRGPDNKKRWGGA